MTNGALGVPALLATRAAAAPQAPLLHTDSRTWTYADVDLAARRLATALRDNGIGPGDRVAVILPNGFTWVVAWFAVLRLGAILVPANRGYRAADLGHLLSDSGATTVLTESDLVATVQAAAGPDRPAVLVLGEPAPAPARSVRWTAAAPDPGPGAGRPEDVASLQYTSGTTGRPKACVLTHGYWQSLAAAVRDLVPLTDDDVLLTAQPFSYLDPQWNLAACVTAGAALVLLPRFSPPAFWPAVRSHGVTWLYLVGTMPLFLLNLPPDPADRAHRLRYVSCSGIVPDLHAALEERWGVPWREAYGMTETGVDLAFDVTRNDSVGTGWLGDPIPSKQIRVVVDDVDVPVGRGELWVRGRPMMSGYWNRPADTAAVLRGDGWLRTGDLVDRDADGHLRLVGRLKDMVRRAGENISAAEVEAVLAQHPAVVAAAVVAVPDPLRGEEVKAYVQPAGSPPEPEDLRAFALARLAAFKVPRYLQWVTSLPLTPSERIAKSDLVPGPTWDAATGEWSDR